MARLRDPRIKKMRALGVQLPGLSRKSTEKRPYPPGQHGQARKKMSEFALRLREKQKLRINYGVSERQLRSVVTMAKKTPGVTGDKILELLERRLDNVVFRAGYAPTIPAARQLINHGHVTVDGKRVDIASFLVKPGHKIGLREKTLASTNVAQWLTELALERPEWLHYDDGSKVTDIQALPTADSVPFPIVTQMVVEYYAQRL